MVERGAWRLLLALAALNVLGYVDRQLVAALAPVLMAELGLSRADIGLLIGPVFVVVFGFTTLFLGAAADLWRRPRIIAGGLAVWSVATAFTGTASGFGTLAVWRALVGVGEAALPPTAVSMLGDRYPSSRLGFATSVYYAGIPVGFALSLAAAGWLVPRFGWRACFLLLGAVGLVAVAAVWRMDDPPRRAGAAAGRPDSAVAAADATAAAGRPSGARVAAGRLRRAFAGRPTLGLLVAGATLIVYQSGSSQHLVTWLVQERGLAYSRAAYLASAVVLLAGIVGSLALGAVTDAAERRWPGGRLFAFVLLGAASLGMTTAFYVLPPASPFFLAAWFVSQAWTLGWFGPMMAALHARAPAESRATVIGFSLDDPQPPGRGARAVDHGRDRRSRRAHDRPADERGVGAVGLVVVGLAAWRERARAGSPI